MGSGGVVKLQRLVALGEVERLRSRGGLGTRLPAPTLSVA
jgi:hypothetical protein